MTADDEDAAKRRCCREHQHDVEESGAQAGRRGCDPAPGWVARLVEVLEALAILDRVHRAKEPFVRVRDQLALVDQASERLFHELVARLDHVEDPPLQDQEAAVDPDVGAAQLLDGGDVPLPVGRDHVRIELRTDGEEHRCFPAVTKGLDDLRKRSVRQPVAVGREELLIVAEVRLHSLQPLSDRGVQTRVDEGNPPLVQIA